MHACLYRNDSYMVRNHVKQGGGGGIQGFSGKFSRKGVVFILVFRFFSLLFV